MKRRNSNLSSSIKRLKSRSALKPFVKALKHVKMSLKFQAMHVKELAKLSAQKVSVYEGLKLY
jgi:hypothetical protein